MRGMLRADLRRAFGVGIWYTAGAMLVLQFMCLLDFLPSAYDSVVALIDYSTGIGRFQSLSPIAACLGFSAAFYQDQKTGFGTMQRTRATAKQYCLSKCIACSLSAMCGVVIGMVLLIVILRLGGHPLLDMEASTDLALAEARNLGPLLEDGHTYLYIAIMVFYRALAAGAWALMGLWISTWIPNIFAIMMLPYILVFGSVYILSTRMNWPISLYKLEYGRVKGLPNAQVEFILTTCVFILLMLLFAYLFTTCVYRRYYQCEKR